MFGLFSRSKEKEAIKCIEELEQLFPDFLNLAKGISGAEKVPEAVAHHPVVLGFLHGFAFTMVVTASQKLRFDQELQYRIIYQAISNALNRSHEFQEIGYRIMRLQDSQNEEFQEHEALGREYLLGISQGEMVRYMGVMEVPQYLNGRVFTMLEEDGSLPAEDR